MRTRSSAGSSHGSRICWDGFRRQGMWMNR